MSVSPYQFGHVPAPKKWFWSLIWGILLMIVGLLAMYYDVFTTLISVIFIGSFLLVSGVIIFFDAFLSWWGKWSAFVVNLIVGILYAIAGWMIIQNPIMASVTLTLLMGAFFVVVGLMRLIYSYPAIVPLRGLRLFSGVISLLLGVLILANWPGASLRLIGLFIGIDIFFTGLTYVMIGMHAKKPM